MLLLIFLYFFKYQIYTEVALAVKYLPVVEILQETQKMQIRSLVWEDPPEKERAAHSGILAWEILWIEEPGGLQYMGSQRVRYN